MSGKMDSGCSVHLLGWIFTEFRTPTPTNLPTEEPPMKAPSSEPPRSPPDPPSSASDETTSCDALVPSAAFLSCARRDAERGLSARMRSSSGGSVGCLRLRDGGGGERVVKARSRFCGMMQ